MNEIALFDNWDAVHPDIQTWTLHNKHTGEEKAYPYQILLNRFGEEELIRIINNRNSYWLAWKND